MIRDITIGQYYKTNSKLHILDPRTKLIGTFVFIVSLFFDKNIFVYLVAFMFLATVIKISKVPLKFIVRGLKPLLFIILFSIVVNMFFSTGHVIWSWWIFNLTREGIITALYTVIRLIMLIIGSSLMTFTTTPNQLTDGLERLFNKLNKIGVPVHEIALMMSIALRFIPILTEELDKIMKAQMARGADFESGNLIKKVKSLVPVIIPLFISAIRRANDLAMAMDARCYNGGEGRTKMKPLKYYKIDYIGLGIVMVYFVAMIILAIIF